LSRIKEEAPMITELRDELRKARALTESCDLVGVRRILDQALDDLRPDRLVTMAEAAEILDLRAVDALAAIMRHEGLPIEPLGDTWTVPLSEVDRVSDSEWVRDMRQLDILHSLSAGFGREEGMTREELDALEEGRYGSLPWNRPQARADRPA
jgi:hypothetical protein